MPIDTPIRPFLFQPPDKSEGIDLSALALSFDLQPESTREEVLARIREVRQTSQDDSVGLPELIAALDLPADADSVDVDRALNYWAQRAKGGESALLAFTPWEKQTLIDTIKALNDAHNAGLLEKLSQLSASIPAGVMESFRTRIEAVEMAHLINNHPKLRNLTTLNAATVTAFLAECESRLEKMEGEKLHGLALVTAACERESREQRQNVIPFSASAEAANGQNLTGLARTLAAMRRDSSASDGNPPNVIAAMFARCDALEVKHGLRRKAS